MVFLNVDHKGGIGTSNFPWCQSSELKSPFGLIQMAEEEGAFITNMARGGQLVIAKVDPFSTFM